MRNLYFDNVKAILIILVIIGHILEPFIHTNNFAYAVYTFIYTFHMPVFVLISGYFSKYIKNLAKAEIKYIIIYTILSIAFSPFYSNSIFSLLLNARYVTWYMLSLAFWYVLLPFFNKLKHPILVSILLALLIGYFKVGEILSISRTLIFLPYFLIGYNLKEEDFFKIKKMISTKSIVIIVSIVVIGIIFLNPNHEILWSKYAYSTLGWHNWYAFIFRIFVYLIYTSITLCFLSLMPITKQSYTWIGKHTLFLYLVHGIVIKILYLY